MAGNKEQLSTPLASWSVFPDNVRNSSIQEIFARIGEPVPVKLRAVATDTSNRWHYVNLLLPDQISRECGQEAVGDLVDILNLLDQTLASGLTKPQEALVLSFQIHLIQDIHQPLHTMTKFDRKCRSDFGGNRTCARKENGKCVINLHALWDSGFGIFSQTGGSRLSYSTDIAFAPKRWARENHSYYSDIYRLDHTEYSQRGRKITENRLSKAVTRLTHYLELHYARHHEKK